jgi:hypothetical protein
MVRLPQRSNWEIVEWPLWLKMDSSITSKEAKSPIWDAMVGSRIIFLCTVTLWIVHLKWMTQIKAIAHNLEPIFKIRAKITVIVCLPLHNFNAYYI